MRSSTQKISLNENHVNVYSAIHSSLVDVTPSSGSAINSQNKESSNCLMVSPLVSYEWEYKYYSSKIITKHMPSGNVAWLIKPSPSQLLVRLTNGRNRSLIKDFGGDFLTLDFSLYDEPILAILSSDGVLKVYHINFNQGNNNLLFTTDLDENVQTLTHCFLKWGPKSKASDIGMHTSLLLAAAVNRKVFLIDLNSVVENLDQSKQSFVEASKRYLEKPRLLSNMFSTISSYDHNVEAITFSADASALFISADRGHIFALNLSDIDPFSFRPVQRWSTDTYSPLFGLYHVDFKSNGTTSGYLIGGTSFCRELRLWRLPDFKLLQTIRFCSNEEEGSVEENKKSSPLPMLISQFDQDSGVLFVSDIKRTVLYTLLLARNPDKTEELRFQCLCEFLLVAPCIAFNLNGVTRSHSFNEPLSDSASADCDNINVDLLLIHPKALTVGKLSFFVPLVAYRQKNLNRSLEFPQSEKSESCSSSPVVSLNPSEDMNMFSRLLNMRPKSVSSSPIHNFQDGDENAPFSPPSSENPPSVESSTPKVSQEGDVPQISTDRNGGNPDTQQVGFEGSSVSGSSGHKIFDLTPVDRNSPSMISAYGHEEPPNPSKNLPQHPSASSASIADSSRIPVLSDSMRCLAGSSSAASLSNSLLRDSSTNDFMGPPNDNMNKAMGLSMKNALSDSARSLDGNSIDTGVTLFQVDPLILPARQHQQGSASAFSLDESLSGGNGDNSGDPTQLLKAVFQQNKEILSSIKTLTNKVQENRNNLAKLSNVQNTILKQVNSLTTVAPGTPVYPVASSPASPPWANQILDQVRKQKAEAAKQLSQLEVAVKNLQLTVPATGTNLSSDVFTAAHPLVSPTVGLNNKQLVEQVRGVVRNELCNLFQTNASKIVEPVIQNLRGNLERILSPLPQIVADRMLTVIKEPKFTQYIADQMGRSLSPVMTEGYRNELRQTLVPGLNSVVDKLCKDLDDLVQGALNRHIQSVTMRIESGVQSNCNKLDSSAKKFDDQIKNLSKDISAKVAGRVGEVLNKALQQQQAKSQQSQSEPFFGGNSSSTAGSGRPSTIPPLNPSPQQQQFKNPNIGSNDTFTKALTFIQSGQYSQALETVSSGSKRIMCYVRLFIKVIYVSPFGQAFA
ncbi:unnamed protein product [Hymenolepis diminuta]|uniref:Enhancer of mRNA-decapping protein 4 WD40 repeat region domain-containing protein n=1 Tax=Hymenolepis diminuta TaxID=6216 RepID=A0A564Y702_HYMDI|nr:unnamed protein product [Hymenolepis diminuta]